ncbi:MAG TPA: hypothetical protein VNK23_02865 [Candidatus Dormibacteraeota bacterium]|nr:hypothetical protein [Candidatus Dormibacteraeota bacterium]
MTSSDTARFDRVRNQGYMWGLIGSALFVIFGVLGGEHAGFAGWQSLFHSYLWAYLYWFCIPSGCMAILMLHHLTGGRWGYPLRRILEAGTRSLWVMAVLFIPIFFGIRELYAWSRPDTVAADPILQQKQWWLTTHGFIFRAVIYFVILLVLVTLLNKWSRAQDQSGDPFKYKSKMTALSAPGVILWGFIVTGAAVDWVMSLEPHWFSTIYGMLWIIIEVLVAMSFSVFVLRMLSNTEPIKDAVDPLRFNDLGNLMLTFLMLWAYLSFDQLLITWAGNLKDEIPWYSQRAFGSWAPIAVVLVILHFFVPFFFLLQRRVKRQPARLSGVAMLIICLTLVDIYWVVVPAFEKSGPQIHWLDLFAIVGIGGLWLGTFMGQLKKLPLLPLHDPRFEGVLEPEHGD